MTTDITRIPQPADAVLAETMTDLAGQLAPTSARTYRFDAQHFAAWLAGEGLDIGTVDRPAFIRYRKHLQDTYAKSTASRMLVIARRLLGEAVKRGVLPANVAADVKGFKSGANETPHTALSVKQANAMLAGIDRSTKIGKRDYALLLLLIRTGIRRAEAAAIVLGDIAQNQGHTVLTIQHGKGDVRRSAKVPVDVLRAISDYLVATGRKAAPKDSPLFVAFLKGDKTTNTAISTDTIERLVKHYGAAAGVDVTPHGLRATFVTLTLEGGAKLQQVQYAAGHADPRTTERYQKRKLNLDDNAVDYLRNVS